MVRKTANQNRRTVLKTFGVAVTVGLAGCTGGGDGSDGGGGGGGSDGGGGGSTTTSAGSVSIQKPWSTDDLAAKAKAEEDGSMTLYTSFTDRPFHEEITQAIQDEYPFFSNASIYAAKSSDVGTRFKQEWQANQNRADVLGAVSDIRETKENYEKYFVNGMQDDYEWGAEFDDPTIVSDWEFYPFNRGPLNIMIYVDGELSQTQVDLLNERGHDAFRAPEFEGVPVVHDQTPQWKSFGFICDFNGKKNNMSPTEWLQAVDDNINIIWAGGHSSGIRQMVSGQSVIQFNSYSHHIPKFEDKGLPVEAVVWDGAPEFQGGTAFSEVKRANNPWTARFYLSAIMEPFVQRYVAQNIPAIWPGRPDLDYQGLDPYIDNLINTEMEFIPVEDVKTWANLGEEVYQDVWGEIPG